MIVLGAAVALDSLRRGPWNTMVLRTAQFQIGSDCHSANDNQDRDQIEMEAR
jgi:hypothetical protein